MSKSKIAFAIAIAFALTFTIVGCSSRSTSTSTSETSTIDSPSAEASSSATAEAPTVSATKQFIEEYNSNSESDLAVVETFDPTDKSSNHYRTEFRLGFWKDSKGQACSTSNVSVDIIEPTNGKIRVYAFGPKDEVIEFYRTAAHILDPQASNEAVEAAIQKGVDGFGGSGISIEGSKLNTILDTPSYKDNGEAMLEMR